MTWTTQQQASLEASSNKGTSTIFLKTKLCKFDAIGACAKKGNCPFAHGLHELQPSPDFHFTKLCPYLVETGRCNAPSCTFAHDEREIRRRRPADSVRATDVAAAVPPPPTPASGFKSTATPSELKLQKVNLQKAQGNCEGLFFPEDGTSSFPLSWEDKYGCQQAERAVDATFPEQTETRCLAVAVAESALSSTGAGTASSASPRSQGSGSELQELPSPRRTVSISSLSSQEWVAKADEILAANLLIKPLDDCDETSAPLASPAAAAAPEMDSSVVYYKTKMCKFHARGACTRGLACTFAHTPEELRPVPEPPRTPTPPKVQQLPLLQLGEGSKVLLTTKKQSVGQARDIILAVKNTFFTMWDAEEEASENGSQDSDGRFSTPTVASRRKRSKSLVASLPSHGSEPSCDAVA